MKTQLMHKYNLNTHKDSGAATFAMAVDETTGLFALGIAICSKNDQFSRKVGRQIATDRLMQGKETIVGYMHSGLPMSANIELALIDAQKDFKLQKESPTSRLVEMGMEVYAKQASRGW